MTLTFSLGLRGAPKISVLGGSEDTVRVSIQEFWISVGSYFTLHIQNNNGGDGTQSFL